MCKVVFRDDAGCLYENSPQRAFWDFILKGNAERFRSTFDASSHESHQIATRKRTDRPNAANETAALPSASSLYGVLNESRVARMLSACGSPFAKRSLF